jgi:hypothetical protein
VLHYREPASKSQVIASLKQPKSADSPNAAAGWWDEAGKQLCVEGEFVCVLERQSSGAHLLAGNGQSGDFHDLAFAAGGRASSLPCCNEVTLGGDGVAIAGSQHGEHGVFDGVHLDVHTHTVDRPADLGLTSY